MSCLSKVPISYYANSL